MKLGMMLKVDENSRQYDFQGHPVSGSRSGDDLSPSWDYFIFNMPEPIWTILGTLHNHCL